MKIQKLINNSVFGKNVVTVITVFLALIALILFAKIELASAEENTKLIQRKYSQMSKEQAEKLVRNNMDKFPTLPLGKWQLPEDKLNAQGTKINEKQWLVFAKATAERLTYTSVRGVGLPKEVLALLKNIPKKAQEVVQQEFVGLDGKVEIVGPFLVIGLLASTVDLTLVNPKCDCYYSAPTKCIIRKGYYVLEVWPGGASLRNSRGQFLVLFKELCQKGDVAFIVKPEKDIKFQTTVSASTNGIEIKVAGRSILLK